MIRASVMTGSALVASTYLKPMSTPLGSAIALAVSGPPVLFVPDDHVTHTRAIHHARGVDGDSHSDAIGSSYPGRDADALPLAHRGLDGHAGVQVQLRGRRNPVEQLRAGLDGASAAARDDPHSSSADDSVEWRAT